jgi:hypothetical protein
MGGYGGDVQFEAVWMKLSEPCRQGLWIQPQFSLCCVIMKRN